MNPANRLIRPVGPHATAATGSRVCSMLRSRAKLRAEWALPPEQRLEKLCNEPLSQQNKLLEAQHGERLDTGKRGCDSGSDSVLEAVGAVNGAAVEGRQSGG